MAVGYGTVPEDKTGGPHAFFFDAIRRYALQSALNLEMAWLLLSMSPSTGSDGTCYGDSGGPHFLGGVESNLMVSITVTGDAMCRATDKTYRLDTPSGQGLPRRLRRPPLSRPDLSQNPADRHPFSLGLFRPRNESCITWNQHPGHQRRRRKGEQRHAGSESMPVQTKAAQDIARPC